MPAVARSVIWNNIVEQDHRAIKRRVRASQGFRSLRAAQRTIQGIETINMIRKRAGSMGTERRYCRASRVRFQLVRRHRPDIDTKVDPSLAP